MFGKYHEMFDLTELVPREDDLTLWLDSHA